MNDVEKRKRVTIDRSKCAGAGLCALNAPKVFDQDDEDGLVVVLDPEPPEELHDAVEDAVRLCPNSVITFGEEEG